MNDGEIDPRRVLSWAHGAFKVPHGSFINTLNLLLAKQTPCLKLSLVALGKVGAATCNLVEVAAK